jgi:predicted O-methyltransferase YrrM
MSGTNPGPAITNTIHPQSVLSNQAIRLLGVATGVNLSKTGDAAVIPVANTTNYSVFQVIFTNASASLSSAYAGVWTAANQGGTNIVANAALSANTSAPVVSQATVATTNTQSAQNLYVNVGTAQAATVDVYVYGYDFSNY